MPYNDLIEYDLQLADVKIPTDTPDDLEESVTQDWHSILFYG